jgi:hypothetical protein
VVDGRAQAARPATLAGLRPTAYARPHPGSPGAVQGGQLARVDSSRRGRRPTGGGAPLPRRRAGVAAGDEPGGGDGRWGTQSLHDQVR